MIKYIISGIIILLISVLLIFIIKLYKQRKKYKEEYIEKRRIEFDHALVEQAQALEAAKAQRQEMTRAFQEWKEQEVRHIQDREEVAKKYIDSLEEQKQARLSAEKEAEANGKANIEALLEQYYDSEITDYTRSLRAAEKLLRDDIEQSMTELYNKYYAELSALEKDIEEYRAKRTAINEEIRREEELKLQQDAHRIILSDNDKNDIKYLVSILDNLRNKELVYKLIWSEYLIKPFQNMIKAMFGSKIPNNVIYCIESSDGKLKYIGKTSADVSKRWTEHIKTSLNIGTVSRSKLHDALFLHWDEYIFSVLEIVPKDQLSTREKYYISFFESDKYGLNMKQGG